jgi:hypothetical protein
MSHAESVVEAASRLFRTRIAREVDLARTEVPAHPCWSQYVDGDMRFADASVEALDTLVTKAMPHEPALQERVFQRMLQSIDAWPHHVTAGILEDAWLQDAAFVAARDAALLGEHFSRRKLGWPGDAAPNDVLRWLVERGDEETRRFARTVLERVERDDWVPVDVTHLATGQKLAPDAPQGDYSIRIDADGYRLIAFALVYLARRDELEDATTALGAARLAWATLRIEDEGALAAFARGALELAGHAPTDDAARDELVASLRAALPHVLDTAGFTGELPATEEEAMATEAGILAWDERFARYLDELGPNGKLVAVRVRENARARLDAYRKSANLGHAGGAVWALWIDSESRPLSLRFGRTLALALWIERVKPRIETAQRKPPSLTRAVTVDVLDLYSRRYVAEDRDGQQALVFPEERGWILVPPIIDGALAGILTRGVGLLTSEIGIDLLEWEVTTAHKRYIAGSSDFRHIAIEGGWSALAHEHLGATGKKMADQVRAIVLAQAHLRFETFGFTGNLLSYAEPRRANHGQRALVTITLGDMLLAGFAHALREEKGATPLTSREGRRLVPILGKAALVGRNRDYAAQRRMIWRFAVALRDHAEELAKEGAVRFTTGAWASLASEAGAPRSGAFLSNVLDAWEKGDDRAPPLIVRSGELVTLHQSRKAALDFLVAGGRLSLRKRVDGKASARTRALGRRPKASKQPQR